MTQKINDKLKKCCELCQSNLDKPCAWLSLGNEYCDTIMEVQADIEIKDKVIEKIKSKLQKHINFCEQESRGHLENKVCHISLKFEKNLLEEVEKVGKENVKD